MSDQEKNILLHFANNMKLFRDSKGWSQEKLAEYANLHRTYIGSIERAEKMPSLATVIKIANALNVSISQLIE